MSLDIHIWGSPVLELNITSVDWSPIVLTPSATQEVMELLKKHKYIPEDSRVIGNCVWDGNFRTDEKPFMDNIPVGGVTLGDVLWPNAIWPDNSKLDTDMMYDILSKAIAYVYDHPSMKRGYEETCTKLAGFREACYDHPAAKISLWW